VSGGNSGQGGLFGRPEALAAAAAGACSALFALWAMRGLPLGGLLLWLTPLPIFAAGFGFGVRAAAYAGAISAAVVVLTSTMMGLAVHLGLFVVPAVLIVGFAMRDARLALSIPLALLGVWPVLLLLLLAAFVPDLETAMREAVEQGLQRMGMPMADAMVTQITQVKAAAAGSWLALLMLGNGWAGHRLASRWDLAPPPAPEAEAIRLPGWYLPLPALAALALLTLGGLVALSAMLLLLVPFFVMGVFAVHVMLRGRKSRPAYLAGFYVLMLLFLQLMAPLMVGLGLFEQYRRRPALPPT
jgi:hypothetical protein